MMSNSELRDLGLLSSSDGDMEGYPRQRTTAALGAGAGRSSSSSASIRSSHHLTLLTAVCVRAALCVVCVGGGHGIDGTKTTTTAATAINESGAVNIAFVIVLPLLLFVRTVIEGYL